MRKTTVILLPGPANSIERNQAISIAMTVGLFTSRRLRREPLDFEEADQALTAFSRLSSSTFARSTRSAPTAVDRGTAVSTASIGRRTADAAERMMSPVLKEPGGIRHRLPWLAGS